MLQYPLFSYLVIFLSGFAASPFLALDFEEAFWLSLFVVLASSFFLAGKRRKTLLVSYLPFLWLFVAGITSHKYAEAQYEDIKSLSVRLGQEDYQYDLVLTGIRQEYDDVIVYEADIKKINGVPFRREKVRFYAPVHFSEGTRLMYRGRLQRPRQAHNYFEFDEEEYFYRNNKVGKIFGERGQLYQIGQERRLSYVLRGYRRFLLGKIEQIPEPLSQYARALILGDRYAFTFEERDVFFRMGIIHLFAISGLHVGIFYLLIRKITGFLQLPLYSQWLICLVALCGYIGVLGAPLSAVRVLVMLSIYIIGKLLRKITPFFQVISLTAFIFLLIEGVQVLWSLSFIFSFLATFGIALSVDITRSLRTTFRGKATFYAVNLFVVSLVINILTLPVTFFQFNYFPWFQSVVNMFFVPLFPLVVAFLWLVTLGGFIISPGAWIFELLNIPVDLVHETLNSFSGRPLFYQYYYPYEAPILFFAAAYLFLLTWYLSRSPDISYQQAKICRKGYHITAVLGVVFLGVFLFSSPTLEVTTPYIGQGQAVIVSAHGKTIVYDCGPPKRGYQPLVDILQKRYQGKVDLLVLSHYHDDHVGNLDALLEGVTPRQAWITPYTENPVLQAEIRETFKEQNIPLLEPTAPYFHQFSAQLAVQVLYPLPHLKMPGENDNSLVLVVDAGKYRMLINGDISSRIERYLIEVYPLESDILFAAHHGSGTSSCLPFLAHNNPAAFVIQCGRNNWYGHPHEGVLQRAQQLSLRIFRTDEQGQINIFSKRRRLYGASYHEGF